MTEPTQALLPESLSDPEKKAYWDGFHAGHQAEGTLWTVSCSRCSPSKVLSR